MVLDNAACAKNQAWPAGAKGIRHWLVGLLAVLRVSVIQPVVLTIDQMHIGWRLRCAGQLWCV